MTDVVAVATPTQLYEQLQELRVQKAPGYMVDWAKQIGSTEAALQASRIGREKVYPLGDITATLQALPTLGKCLAITRNHGIVHEYKGVYPKAQIGTAGPHPAGIFLDIGGLDLRLFMNFWHWGCAIEDTTDKGTRHSLQFFDQHGEAVHKVFALPETDMAAWNKLVQEQADTSASEVSLVTKPVVAATHKAPADAAKLDEEWRAMKDVHEFFGLVRKHGVTRYSALQHVGTDLSREVNAVAAFETLVTEAAKQSMEIMFFVGSRGCVQIYTGKTRGIQPMRGWLNIFEPDFTLHANPATFDKAYVVRKPIDTGWVTSLEVFDAQGSILLQMFGRREEGAPEQKAWADLLNSLPSLA